MADIKLAKISPKGRGEVGLISNRVELIAEGQK
jgi:hypothetical protein